MNYIRKPSIVIGIPAYNEEKNIGKLIRSLAAQVDKSGKKLKLKILVVSDNSSDNTMNIVRSYLNKQNNLNLVVNNRRKGKPSVINNIFNLSESDIVVILDADITLSSNKVIYDLVKPMITNSNIMLTSGLPIPIAPNSFTEKIHNAQFEFWKNAKEITPHSELYSCEGPIRAFNKKLYKKMVLPDSTAEDVYPYLYCMYNGLKFTHVKKAIVFYKPASNIGDYLKQMSRAINTNNALNKVFPENFLSKYYVINYHQKIKAFIRCLWINPLWTIISQLLLVPIKISSLFNEEKDSGIWESIGSTK